MESLIFIRISRDESRISQELLYSSPWISPATVFYILEKKDIYFQGPFFYVLIIQNLGLKFCLDPPVGKECSKFRNNFAPFFFRRDVNWLIYSRVVPKKNIWRWLANLKVIFNEIDRIIFSIKPKCDNWLSLDLPIHA